MEYGCYIVFSVCFFIAILIMVHVNHQLMKGADRRLASANEMVKKLSESCDKLAETNMQLQKHINFEEERYKKDLDELRVRYESESVHMEKQLESWKSSYTKLLHKYELLEDKMITNYENMQSYSVSALREMAARPTISNNNTSTDLT